jgi:hypothetical protein
VAVWLALTAGAAFLAGYWLAEGRVSWRWYSADPDGWNRHYFD